MKGFMKVKFIQHYKTYCRGMEYPIEQVGKKAAEQLEKSGIAKILPLIETVTETVKDEPIKIEPVKAKPIKKKGKK